MLRQAHTIEAMANIMEYRLSLITVIMRRRLGHMEEILISFVSRTDSFRFSDILTKANIPNTIVNTPRAISSSCGISVKSYARYIRHIRSLLALPISGNSLIGIYEVINGGRHSSYNKIYGKNV